MILSAPVRIVSLLPSATEILAALELGDRVVGITHSCDYPAEILDRPRVTSTSIPVEASSGEIDAAVRERVGTGQPLYEIDVELLDRLEPDLLITQGVCDVCAVCEVQALTALPQLSREPRVLNLVPHRLADVLDDVVRIGRATGVDDRARELVAASHVRIDAVRRRVDARPPVSVVILEWIDPLFSSGHWTPEIASLAGGEELIGAAGARSRRFEWDEILELDPSALVLACCGHDVSRTVGDWDVLRALPRFAELRCVLEDRVFVADGAAHFSRPSLRLLDSLELLAEAIHPSGDPSAKALTRVSEVLSEA